MTQLETIRPRERLRVIDLVSAAGLDVRDWSNFEGGEARAAVNPKYCYEWAFVERRRAIVLNLWHSDMRENAGEVSVAFTLRDRDDLIGPRKARAERLLQAIEFAEDRSVPLRVIVNAGKADDVSDDVAGPTRVSARLLDPSPWRVEQCDRATGRCLLKRGAPDGGYVDQFSARDDVGSDEPLRAETTAGRFVRDPAVRAAVLSRAKGRCEYCNEFGFVMADGRVYLETHHVVALAEGGVDRVGNVVALCANHHREAHYAARASSLRHELLDLLSAGGFGLAR